MQAKIQELTPQEAAYIMGMIMTCVDGEYTIQKGNKVVDYIVKNQLHEFQLLNPIFLEHPKEDILHGLWDECMEKVRDSDENHRIEVIYMLYAIMMCKQIIIEAEERLFTKTCEYLSQDDLKQLIA